MISVAGCVRGISWEQVFGESAIKRQRVPFPATQRLGLRALSVSERRLDDCHSEILTCAFGRVMLHHVVSKPA
jgi:hypothetical protein